MQQTISSTELSPETFDGGLDPIEDRLRSSIRGTIEAVFEEELSEFLGRLRYRRGDGR